MRWGELIDTSEALRLNIVNRVVSAETFDDEVRRWAATIATKSPLLMRMGKDAIDFTRDMTLPAALDAMRAQLALAFTTDDIHEGVAAFREKRQPVWSVL